MPTLRDTAHSLFQAAVDRADPAEALRRYWRTNPVSIQGGGRCFVVAVGKAAVPMMQAALAKLPPVEAALTITNPENAVPLKGARLVIGAHPVPDRTSMVAGRAVVSLLQQTRRGDRVIALISGGGSALMAAPVNGISPDDYAQAGALLLTSGLDIAQMNLVRQQMDDLKGGGMLRYAAPASVDAYLLSDVIGDDPRAIASGPTASPIGTPEDAIAVLRAAQLWKDMPAAIRRHLQSPRRPDPVVQVENHVIGSNRHSLAAMVDAVPKGINARIACDRMVGDVRDAAERILQSAEETGGSTALIFGGETTVQLNGTGLGGRNLELALRVAIGAENRLAAGWTFLSAGTDGRDGPTDAAGAIVDSGTLARIRAAGNNPTSLLANNDSYTALKQSGDLLLTGGTGTNVADVQAFIRA